MEKLKKKNSESARCLTTTWLLNKNVMAVWSSIHISKYPSVLSTPFSPKPPFGSYGCVVSIHIFSRQKKIKRHGGVASTIIFKYYSVLSTPLSTMPPFTYMAVWSRQYFLKSPSVLSTPLSTMPLFDLFSGVFFFFSGGVGWHTIFLQFPKY